MTQQELQLRIEKKESDIKKIEKRIAKWTEGMNSEAKEILLRCKVTPEDPTYKPSYQEYADYKFTHDDDPSVFRQDYENKGPNFQEAYSAYRDLATAEATLRKYKEKLTKAQAFQSEEKIQVIWDFLQMWRANAYEFFVENCGELGELQAHEKEEWEAFKAADDAYNSYTANWQKSSVQREWRERYYQNIHSVTKMVYTHSGKWDDEKLNKLLDKDVESKYKDFIARIAEKAGNIQDATGLSVAGNGVVNGIVVGDEHTVRVETILAGGYNIQCLHYRVLVHIVK